MSAKRGILTILIALSVQLTMLVSPAGANTCDLPPQVSKLVGSLSNLPHENGPIPVTKARGLQRYLDEIDINTLVASALKQEERNLAYSLASMFNEARHISSTAILPDARKLHLLLRNLDLSFDAACGRSAMLVQDKFDLEFFIASSDSMAADLANGLSQFVHSTKISLNTSMFGLGGISFMVILILAFDHGARYVLARRYNLRACVIPVAIHVKNVTVHATITTLGRSNCQIEPVEHAEYDKHIELLGKFPVRIEFKHHTYVALASAIYDDVSEFQFAHDLTIAGQNALLDESKITPFFVKQDRRPLWGNKARSGKSAKRSKTGSSVKAG